jgi:hypothetical protein
MEVQVPRTKKTTTPSPRLAGRGPGRGDLNLTRHLTPTLSPNSVGGEGENGGGTKTRPNKCQRNNLRLRRWQDA